MVLLKSVTAGAFAAITVVIAIVLFEIVSVLGRMRGSGSGGIGAVSSGLVPELIVVAAAFVAGFCWQFRRQMALRGH
jgi:hypothetical protein